MINTKLNVLNNWHGIKKITFWREISEKTTANFKSKFIQQKSFIRIDSKKKTLNFQH